MFGTERKLCDPGQTLHKPTRLAPIMQEWVSSYLGSVELVRFRHQLSRQLQGRFWVSNGCRIAFQSVAKLHIRRCTEGT